MTRSEMIEALCAKMSQLSYKEVEDSIKLIFESIIDALSRGRRVEVRGFGSFSLRKRKERLARNPKTGEKVLTPSKHSPHFKPGKDLRDRVNEAAKRGCPIEDD